MNVFGAFTFGSLIKTFIPGLVWLVALALVADDLAWLTAALPHLAPPNPAEEVSLLALAIPAAILLGLLSNICVFLGINDRLVRAPCRVADPALHGLHQWLCRALQAEFRRGLPADPTHDAAFHTYVDPELLALQTIGVTNLAYVREQYWYHLEFQVNLVLATVVLLIATLASPHVYALPAPHAAARAALAVVALGGTAALLLGAARRNYQRHVAKMSSLLATVLRNVLADSGQGRAQPTAPGRVSLGRVAAIAGLSLVAGLSIGRRRRS